MPGQHMEYAFETAIEHHLTTAGGFERGDRNGLDIERGLFIGDVIAFIRKTQPKEWDYLANLQKEKAEETLIDGLCRALKSGHEGCLSVLRHGFKCFCKVFHKPKPNQTTADHARMNACIDPGGRSIGQQSPPGGAC